MNNIYFEEFGTKHHHINSIDVILKEKISKIAENSEDCDCARLHKIPEDFMRKDSSSLIFSTLFSLTTVFSFQIDKFGDSICKHND